MKMDWSYVIPTGPNSGMTLRDRFWKAVDVKGKNKCWEWREVKYPNGYGNFYAKGKQLLAHRVSYELEKSKPGDLYVLHACDNRSCVNPNHLFLGTQLDNVHDALQKGRWNPPAGERCATSKLTSEKVIEIRKLIASGQRIKDIAEAFCVTASVISNIKARRYWKHV